MAEEVACERVRIVVEKIDEIMTMGDHQKEE